MKLKYNSNLFSILELILGEKDVALAQRFSSVFEVGPLLKSEHILVPFEKKINVVAYFNISILTCNLARSTIGVRRTVKDQIKSVALQLRRAKTD